MKKVNIGQSSNLLPRQRPITFVCTHLGNVMSGLRKLDRQLLTVWCAGGVITGQNRAGQDSILANFGKVEVGTLEIGCDLDHSDREAIIVRASPSLF